MSATTWTEVTSAIYLVLALGVLAGLVVALRAFVRLLVGTRETRRRPLLGSDTRSRLLGLAITAIFFTPLLGRLVRSLIRLTLLLFDRVPRHVLARWRTRSDFCDGGSVDCVTDAVLVLINAFTAGVGAALRDSGLLSIGFGYVVLWLALWVLATAVVSTITENTDAGEQFDVKGMLLGPDHAVTRQNLLFFLVLFVGAYLSLASIAAIPDLRVDTGAVDQTVVPESLAVRLRSDAKKAEVKAAAAANPLQMVDQTLYPALSGLHLRALQKSKLSAGTEGNAPAGTPAQEMALPGISPVPADSGAQQPRAAQDSAAAGARTDEDAREPAAANTTATPAAPAPPRTDTAQTQPVRLIADSIPPLHVAAIQAEAIRLRALWTRHVARHDSVLQSVERRQDANIKVATAAYADTDTTRRLRDQSAYFHRLRRWFAEADANLRAEFDASQAINRHLWLRLEGWSTAAAGYLTGTGPDSLQVEALRDDARRIRSEESLIIPPDPFAQRQLPERGAGLGPFKYVSGWLLKTDSMPLTLIVGMMGFGLLGAAASTFVRDQTARQRQEEKEGKAAGGKPSAPEPASDDVQKESEKLLKPPVQPLVRNLPSVVIRGGSAAIVVFLGIMGGLSVFTQEADPNPYALLFTCLVGAVFSEQVWVWAEKRFGMSFNRDGDDDGKGAAGDDPAAGKADATKASRVYVIVAKPTDVVVVDEGAAEAAPRGGTEARAPVTEPKEDPQPEPRRRRGGFLGRIFGRRRRRPAAEPPPAPGE